MKGSEEVATKYEKYQVPVEPADPDAEYLTVQETAFVFRCSVQTIRRLRKELELGGRVGSRIVLDRDERRAMFDARRSGGPKRVPSQRKRRSAPAKRAAAKTPAAA